MVPLSVVDHDDLVCHLPLGTRARLEAPHVELDTGCPGHARRDDLDRRFAVWQLDDLRLSVAANSRYNALSASRRTRHNT